MGEFVVSKKKKLQTSQKGGFFIVKNMKIMKFGGSSLGTGQRILNAAEIIKKISEKTQVIIVVSAMCKVTDMLVSIFQKYKSGDFESALKEIRCLYKIHKNALDDLGLLPGKNMNINKSILELLGEFSLYLALHNKYSLVNYDYCISFGERLSSCLLSSALRKINVDARVVDASQVIVANNKFGNAKVLIKETKAQAKKSLLPLLSKKIIPVVSGFFAVTKNGNVITLGRGGSDYSATILANVLDAEEVILWKEVDGVFSTDPNKNSKAEFYSELSYKKALFLAKNGAKILHPEALKPVSSKQIVVRVKNTFRPDFIGTKIWKGAFV